MQHSHGVEGSETSLLQCFAGQFSQSQLSAVNLIKASWVEAIAKHGLHQTVKVACSSV